MTYVNKKEGAEFVKQLKAIRKQANLTQKEVAMFCCVSEVTYQKYEKGETKPNADFIMSFIKLCGGDAMSLVRALHAYEQSNRELKHTTIRKFAIYKFRQFQAWRLQNYKYVQLYLGRAGKFHRTFSNANFYLMVGALYISMLFSYKEYLNEIMMQNLGLMCFIVICVLYLCLGTIYIVVDEILFWRWKKKFLDKLDK